MSDLITEAVEGWKTANTEYHRLGASHRLMNNTDYYASGKRIADEQRTQKEAMDKWRKRHAQLTKILIDGWTQKQTDDYFKSL